MTILARYKDETAELQELEPGPDGSESGTGLESEIDPALDDEPQKITINQFMEKYHESMTRRIKDTYRPRYQPTEDNVPLPKLLRAPMGRQEFTIRGIVKSLKDNLGTTVVGEMGSGKTMMAITAARMGRFRRVLVMCPPHLVFKWKREVETTLPPDEAAAVIVSTVTDMQRLDREFGRGAPDDGRTLFIIMSREKAKLSHTWETQVYWKLPIVNGILVRNGFGDLNVRHGYAAVTDGDGNLLPEKAWEGLQRHPVCVRCGQRLRDEDGIPLTEQDVLRSKKKLSCLNQVPNPKAGPGALRKCGAKLWQAARQKNITKNRIGLTEYARKKMPGFFDLFVADEVHEYKGKNTAQGLAAADGAILAGKALVLTGTLMGGYSSTLFYLLFRFKPEFRSLFRYDSTNDWVRTYGFYEHTVRFDDGPDRVIEHGSNSRRSHGTRRPPKEKPGLMPAALFHLIENCAFIRLNDVSSSLPPYEEHVITIPMDDEEDAGAGYSQLSAYQALYEAMHEAMMEALAEGSARLMAAYLQTMLAYPDAVTKGETAVDPLNNEVLADIPPLREDRNYPKEQELIDLVRAEQRQGRKVLVYVNHTNRRDITGRIRTVLQNAGIHAIVLKSDTVPANKREEWIENQILHGAQVLICNPKLVQTGLDLIHFPSIVWYETEYSVYTMRQASRRSWRIGQDQPVNVYFMTYQNCLQADALKLVAQKVQSSLAVEGELPEEGLSAYGDTGDNLFVTLARQIAGKIPKDDTSPEELARAFRRARETDRRDELQLVDEDEWKLPEPAAPASVAPETAAPATVMPEPEPALAGRNNSRNNSRKAKRNGAEPEPARPQPDRLGKNGQMTMFSMEAFLKK